MTDKHIEIPCGDSCLIPAILTTPDTSLSDFMSGYLSILSVLLPHERTGLGGLIGLQGRKKNLILLVFVSVLRLKILFNIILIVLMLTNPHLVNVVERRFGHPLFLLLALPLSLLTTLFTVYWYTGIPGETACSIWLCHVLLVLSTRGN